MVLVLLCSVNVLLRTFAPLNNILLLLTLSESGLCFQEGILSLLGGLKLKIRGNPEVAYCIFCLQEKGKKKKKKCFFLYFIFISFATVFFFPHTKNLVWIRLNSLVFSLIRNRTNALSHFYAHLILPRPAFIGIILSFVLALPISVT